MKLTRQMNRVLASLIVAAALLLGDRTAHAEVVVVVTSNHPTRELSKEDVANIFLGRSSRFPDGREAIPIDQAESSPARKAFYSRYLAKSPAQMKAHWSKIIFTGRGQPPKEMGDDEQVRRLVAANPGMIGYVDSSVVDDSVRVLLRP